MRINLPNQITLGRLVLAIVFFAVLSQYDQTSPAAWILDICLVLFIVAALSDILDGHLARRHNQVTSLGRILDPFVDKVLVCGVFVYFASEAFVDARGVNVTGISAWMVVLIVGREFMVTGLRGFTEANGRAYGANFYGKLKMVVQSVTACVVLFLVAHPHGVLASRPVVAAKTFLIWLTVFVTTVSLIQYLARSKDILAQAHRP